MKKDLFSELNLLINYTIKFFSFHSSAANHVLFFIKLHLHITYDTLNNTMIFNEYTYCRDERDFDKLNAA